MSGSIAPVEVGSNSTSTITAAGDSILLQGISLTKTHPLSDLNLALGRDPLSRQLWLVVTDEPASLQTFREYGERFQIAEELRRRKI